MSLGCIFTYEIRNKNKTNKTPQIYLLNAFLYMKYSTKRTRLQTHRESVLGKIIAKLKGCKQKTVYSSRNIAECDIKPQ